MSLFCSIYMILVTGVMQLIIIVFVLIYEYKRKSPAIFMWATLFLMFGVMHFISSWGSYTLYSEEVLIQAASFVSVFSLIYLGTRVLFVSNSKKKVLSIEKEKDLREIYIYLKKKKGLIIMVTIIIFSMRVIPFIVFGGGILNTSWEKGREFSEASGYFNLGQPAGILYYAISGMMVLFWIVKMRKEALFEACFVIATTLITRNRVDILPILCCVIYIFIKDREKVSLKLCLIGACAAIFSVYLLYVLRAFRWYGSLSNAFLNFNLSDLNALVMQFLKSDNGELGLRQYFYYFIKYNNSFENFNMGHTYIRMLLVYIPTKFSFGLKPPDFAISMGAAVGMAKGGSMHPTLFGDMFANFGWSGVLFGFFWGMLISLFDKLIRVCRKKRYSILIYILCGCSYVIIARGAVYNGFFPLAYGVILLLFLDRLGV